MRSMTITEPQLKAALLSWEQAARDGKTRSHDEANALPLEQVATESAAHLWTLLGTEFSVDAMSVDQAALDAAVAEERQRLQADAEEWGNALNAAGWAVTEAYRKHTGEIEPATFFNHAKAILRDGIAAYFAALNDEVEPPRAAGEQR